jgi:hypothetical protein
MSSLVRQRSFGAVFAILISPVSVLVLCFGLMGVPGNSTFTGGLLTLSVLAVGLLSFRGDLALMPSDYLFCALVAGILSSFVSNGMTADTKECALLALSLAAYPACRFLTQAKIASGVPAFLWTTGVVALLGTIVTAATLVIQWNDGHGKPIVFGFDAAGTYFLQSLSFFVIAAVTIGRTTTRRTVIILVLIFLPMVVFAASLVRFMFVALIGALFLAAIVSDSKKRALAIAATVTAILLAVAVGLIARSDRTRVFVDYAMERTLPRDAAGSKNAPSCHLKSNLENSISIRKALLQDALFLIPKAGWFGTGLDSFMKFSCIESTQIHVSFLQAAAEFGWFGGVVLLLLTLVSGGSLLLQARQDDATRFVMCGLAFVVLLSFVHGSLSRDIALFAFLGCAVGLRETAAGRVTSTAIAIKA